MNYDDLIIITTMISAYIEQVIDYRQLGTNSEVSK